MSLNTKNRLNDSNLKNYFFTYPCLWNNETAKAINVAIIMAMTPDSGLYSETRANATHAKAKIISFRADDPQEESSVLFKGLE